MMTQNFLNFHKLAEFYKTRNSEFFRGLAANLWSKLQNSKFQIQCGC